MEERLKATRRVWGTCCTSPPQLADDAFLNQEQSGAARRLKQDLSIALESQRKRTSCARIVTCLSGKSGMSCSCTDSPSCPQIAELRTPVFGILVQVVESIRHHG